jgi:hypothetical protein
MSNTATHPLLNLDDAPADPIERLLWLSGVDRRVRTELEAEFQRLYFELRVEGRLGPALDLRLHSSKRVLAWTRHENEARGRLVRWGDDY